MKRRILFGLWLLAGTYAFLYFWDATLIGIPVSETVWTFYFHLLGQSNLDNMEPAADLEYLTAIVIGLSLSYGVARLFLFLVKRTKRAE